MHTRLLKIGQVFMRCSHVPADPDPRNGLRLDGRIVISHGGIIVKIVTSRIVIV